jgi:putative ABC transport system permease protein
MSHRLWRRRFGGDPAILGRTISVDSIPTTVIGVLPVGAEYPGFADLWQPVSQYRHQEILQRRGFHADSRTLGRLRAGVDSARADALMRAVGARLAEAYPADQAHWMPGSIPLRQEIIGGVGPMLWTLSAAAAAVLLLACTNVASLLLARVATRTRELAVRSALGASRRRMVRQLLTESLLLSVIGGGLGAALAFLAVASSRKFLADQLPRIDDLRVDWRVLLIAGLVTILTAIVCGVWPAFRATRTRGSEVLRASALGSIGVRTESRLRRMLVSVQFALALVLLVGAGLLFQSFRRAAEVRLGFDPGGVLTFRIRAGGYETPEAAAALYSRLMETVKGVPGVDEAAFINHAPYGSASITTTLTIDGRSTLDSSNQVFYRTVSASYLRTMKMVMASGRWFDDDDIRSPGGSIIINQTMATQYWPGGSALGQRITVTRASQARKDFGKPIPATIVGVVADVHQASQDAAPQPEVYVPYTLETWPWGMLIVRARDGSRAIPALVRAVRSVDSRLVGDGVAGAKDFGVLETAVAGSLRPRLLAIKLIGAFAACALILATIGMYGVVTYAIAQRTREFGVRKALGATNGSIVSLILRESAVVLGTGAVLGAGAAWGAARLIRGLLFNTAITDPNAYGIAIALLASVALVAAYVPARRAMMLDPVIALRGD